MQKKKGADKVYIQFTFDIIQTFYLLSAEQ